MRKVMHAQANKEKQATNINFNDRLTLKTDIHSFVELLQWSMCNQRGGNTL